MGVDSLRILEGGSARSSSDGRERAGIWGESRTGASGAGDWGIWARGGDKGLGAWAGLRAGGEGRGEGGWEGERGMEGRARGYLSAYCIAGAVGGWDREMSAGE